MKQIINIIVILTFAGPFFVKYCDIAGLGQFSDYMVLVQRLLLFICVGKSLVSNLFNFSTEYKSFLAVFLIYSAYTLYYMMFPQVPITDMLGVPGSIQGYISMFVTLLMLLLIPNLIKLYVDIKFIAKVVTVGFTVLFVLYFKEVNFLIYSMFSDTGSFEEYGVIHPFILDTYAMIGVSAAVMAKGAWGNNRLMNNLLLWGPIITFIAVIIVCNKRGPVLYAIMTVAIFLFFKSQISVKTLSVSLVALITIYFFMPQIIGLINDYAPGIIERFMAVSDDGASGRMGSEDSIYNMAIDQILKNPYTGTYFRLTSGKDIGAYPHNFFLETIMTFGLFSLLLYYYVYKAFSYAASLIRDNSDGMFFFLIFCYSFLLMMSTGSLLLNTNFWATLSLILIYKNCNDEHKLFHNNTAS